MPPAQQLSLNHSNLTGLSDNYVQLALTVYDLAGEAVGDSRGSRRGEYLPQCDKG